MMNIPYSDIIKLYQQKNNDSEGLVLNYINNKIRKREIKKIIDILIKSLQKNNIIYKKDLCAFFTFLEQLQTLIGSELIEFSPESNLYINRVDNINYSLMFRFSEININSKLYEYEVKLITEDTVSKQYDYFICVVKTTYEDGTDHTTRKEISSLDSSNHMQRYDRTHIYAKYIYEMMITSITKYLYRLID